VKQDGEYKVNDKWKLDRLVPKLERTNELLGGRTTVTKLNAMDYLIEPKEGVVFADPPYFVAGDALYPCRMSMAEHFQLADRLRNQRRWLATYDDSCVVRGIYSWASVTPFDVQYVMRQDLGSRRHCRELLIGPARVELRSINHHQAVVNWNHTTGTTPHILWQISLTPSVLARA
jgi:site-specific DNA-adenine methylase